MHVTRKSHMLKYIDELLVEITESSFLDGDLCRLFGANAYSLNIIRNYTNLIIKCQDHLDEHYRKIRSLYLKSIREFKKPTPSDAKVYRDERLAKSKVRSKERTDYIRVYNDALSDHIR